jgi:cytoskeletal protein CcmA (bactofilin family)
MKRKRAFTGLGVVTTVLVLLLVAAGTAQAFEERSGQTVVIRAGEVISDDLVVAAETFVLNGTVKGDLLAVGGTITVGSTGVVEGDLIAAGREVVVDGTVKDDARIAGAVLKLGGGGQIGDDLMGAGYSLETAPGSVIGGSLLFVGSQALLEGEVKENADVGVGGLSLQGVVGGDVKASVGARQDQLPFSPFTFMPDMPAVPSVPYGLTVGPAASVGGQLEYTAREEASIPSGVVTGPVTHTEPIAPEVQMPAKPAPTAGERGLNWFAGLVRNTATLLIVGLLLAWLAPGLLRRGSEVLRAKPWPCLGWGLVSYLAVIVGGAAIFFVSLVLTVLLAVLTLGKLAALVMIIGLLLQAILVVGFVIAAGLLAKIIVSFLIGRLILRQLDPMTGAGRVWPLVLGIVLLAIVVSIPFLGFVMSAIATVFGLGALWLMAAAWLKGRRAGAAGELSS